LQFLFHKLPEFCGKRYDIDAYIRDTSKSLNYTLNLKELKAYKLFFILYCDIPSIDAIELPHHIYKIPAVDYRKVEIDQIIYTKHT